MNEEQVEVAVTLTRREVAEIGVKALLQGISTPDFLSYCVRAMTFGINCAIEMLPKQGQVGTKDEDNV